MEKLNQHMAYALSRFGELTIVGPRGCRSNFGEDIEVFEMPGHSLLSFLVASYRQVKALKGKEFDVVIAGSGLTAPLSIFVKKRSSAISGVYVHGLDLVARHPVYRLIWIPLMRRLDFAFANSTSTADIALRMGIAGGNVRILHPGVELPNLDGQSRTMFRNRFGLSDRPTLLSVGRLTARKGLSKFIEESLPRIVEAIPEVVLIVIGGEAKDALLQSRNETVSNLQAIADRLGLSRNIRFLGSCDDATLASAYSGADVHIFPLRKVEGDIEGFGMVAVEAASHGLPTVAFSIGGVADAIEEGKSGYLVSPGDYDSFTNRIIELLDQQRSSFQPAGAKKHASRFSWERFYERLLSHIHAVLSGGGSSKDRRGHAVLDLDTRPAKARKMIALLGLQSSNRQLKVLEIGTGSGGIAHYFGKQKEPRFLVHSVDVEDSRQVHEGFEFSLVDGVDLPFKEGAFDLVLSNHVIEHVGDEAAQKKHIDEMYRVLKDGGAGYLAFPNRWQWREPHYKLGGLSWLPEGYRSMYLKLRRRGSHYDCRPLSCGQIEPLLASSGFAFSQVHGRALKLTYELEQPDAMAYRALFRHIPDSGYAFLRRLFPTLVYLLRKG